MQKPRWWEQRQWMVPVQREFLRVLPLPQSLQVGSLLRKKVDSGLFSRTSGLLKGRVVVTIPEMSRSRNLASGDGGGGKWQRISLNGGVVSSGMAVNYAGRASQQTNQPASQSHQLFPVCKNLCFEQNSSSSTNLLWSVPPQCCHVPSHHDHLRLQVPSKLPKGEASWWRMDGSGFGRRTVVVDVKSIGYIPWADSVNPSRYRVSKLADRLA